MAKKFGKFLLFTAAVGAAGAAAYYYMQKKDSALHADESDEDYDDFSDALGDADTSSRTYVSLNQDNAAKEEKEEKPAAEDDFTPLKEQVAQAAENAKDKAEETVEEFFDEEDPSETEPTIAETEE